MKKVFTLFVLLALVSLNSGCAGTKTVELDQNAKNDVQPPDWYLDTPQDDEFIYAAATSVSQDVQVSVDNATISCREELGKQLDLKLKAIESRFEEESGFMEDAELKLAYKSAVNVAVENNLQGSRTKDKHLVREGELWRAYILMELPLEGIEKDLVEGVKANEELNTKLGSTKVFEEIGG